MLRNIAVVLATLCAAPLTALDAQDYLELARRGWNYELRTTMIGRDMSIPVHIHGQDLAGAAICIVGDAPHPLTQETLKTFTTLLEHSFGKRVPMRYAGPSITGCGTGRTVVLRLYSGFPPNRSLSDDLNWLNRSYDLGLPSGRGYAATSPAMAQTFFGRVGQGTHIMVKQPAQIRLSDVERAFYTSILVEELFQTFTFGMDILQLDPSAGFQSKLQERPFNLRRMSWDSFAFMRALLSSNPKGLCAFDLLMLHAVARTSVDETTDPDFITYIETEFETLASLADQTGQDSRFTGLLDQTCADPLSAESPG